MAWHATEWGFEYWLDVHDPKLAFANAYSLPMQIKAVLIAAIIEMGLLGDYLSLAYCALTKDALEQWFKQQPCAQRAVANTLWKGPGEPKVLPN